MRQVIDLHTRIVVVKLARHIPACRVQHAAQTIAHRRAATMPHMQRPGRVGGNELHPHLASRAEVDVTIARTRLQHTTHHALFRRRGDEHIDESRPGDLHLLDRVGFRQCRDQRLRDVARRFAQRLGQLHRQIAGVIAMRCQLGTLDEYLGLCCVGSDLAQRLREQFGQMGFEIQYDRHETAPLTCFFPVFPFPFSLSGGRVGASPCSPPWGGGGGGKKGRGFFLWGWFSSPAR